MADSTIITGQYVQIDQTPASIGERILARIVDGILMAVYSAAVIASISYYVDYVVQYVDESVLTLAVILILPVFFYSLLWEVFNQGQSPGKKIMGIRVVKIDGSTPELSAYLLRWMLLMLDIHFSYGGIGILSILLTKNNQRLGDLAAGTLVIKEKDFRKINVTLDEFKHLGADYRPIFPQAENLSVEQANLISRTLNRYDEARSVRIGDLAVKVREFLQINPPVHDEVLLQTLLRDFQYYAMDN
jgi:uncharacterized RDD family membrane protein YckC